MEELAPASLGDGASEEQLQAVSGEQRLFVLREEEEEEEAGEDEEGEEEVEETQMGVIGTPDQKPPALLTCLCSHPSLSSSCFCRRMETVLVVTPQTR